MNQLYGSLLRNGASAADLSLKRPLLYFNNFVAFRIMVELDDLTREIENRQSRLRELDSSLQDMAPRLVFGFFSCFELFVVRYCHLGNFFLSL